jgi:hypothetical protein
MNSPDDKLEPEAALRFVVDEIKECNIILEAFVADAPERCACKGLRSLAGKYRLLLNFIVLHVFVALILLLICLLSCDVCLSKGKTVKRFVRHDYMSMISERRTLEETKRIATSGLSPKDEARKGVKQYSPLFDIEGFDVFKMTPVEPMHNQDLGLTRQLLSRLTKGQSKEANHIRSQLETLLLEYRGVHEMSRRLRSMEHFKNFKSAEFQAIGLNIFPYFFGILLNSYDPPVTDDDTFR